MDIDGFAQSGFSCRLEWGWRGAKRAARRGDSIVVVDVLSFSTTAATAAARGAAIYPCRNASEAQKVTDATGAEPGGHRRDVPEKCRFSLSPLTFLGVENGTQVALPSPNGATCCRLAGEAREQVAPVIFVGALVNAQATACAAAAELQNGSVKAITILACGERWDDSGEDPFEDSDGPLRFAIEDLWGAGAVLSCLPLDLTRSPEAQAAQAAFMEASPEIEKRLLACGSGQELVEKGWTGDVIHAACLNAYDTAAVFANGKIAAAFAV